jgi:hypothetical protein
VESLISEKKVLPSPQLLNAYNCFLKNLFITLKPTYIYNSISVAINIGGFPFMEIDIEILQPAGGRIKESEFRPNHYQFTGHALYPLISINREEKYTKPKSSLPTPSCFSLWKIPNLLFPPRLARPAVWFPRFIKNFLYDIQKQDMYSTIVETDFLRLWL